MRAARRIGSLLLVVAAAAGCRTAAPEPAAPIVQPGAPGEPSRPVAAAAARDLSRVGTTEADVKFMQGMIQHHAQALDMTELLRTRTRSDAMKKLALRIELSQADEIAMMRRWLEARGRQVPGPHAHHMPGAPLMPGMLTEEAMDRLAQASGPAFDRLFLEGMITHHEGALSMVKELFATPRAAQDSEMFAFASDVDADQRMEIQRMAAMLKELQK